MLRNERKPDNPFTGVHIFVLAWLNWQDLIKLNPHSASTKKILFATPSFHEQMSSEESVFFSTACSLIVRFSGGIYLEFAWWKISLAPQDQRKYLGHQPSRLQRGSGILSPAFFPLCLVSMDLDACMHDKVQKIKAAAFARGVSTTCLLKSVAQRIRISTRTLVPLVPDWTICSHILLVRTYCWSVVWEPVLSKASTLASKLLFCKMSPSESMK